MQDRKLDRTAKDIQPEALTRDAMNSASTKLITNSNRNDSFDFITFRGARRRNGSWLGGHPSNVPDNIDICGYILDVIGCS